MQTEWWDASDPSGAVVREFRIRTEGARDITGALWMPEQGAEGHALICFGHGASGDRFQIPIPRMAARFVGRGHPVLSLDGPVHGLREQDGGGLKAFIPEFLREGSVADMAAEWHAAIAMVRDETGAGTGAIAYFGLSMGTLLGTQMLAERDDVAVAVLGLAGLSAAQPHGAALREAASEIRAPLLFLMQLEDERVRREHALALFDAFGSDDKRLHAHPGAHAAITVEEIDFSVDFMLGILDAPDSTPDILKIADYGDAANADKA